MLRNNADAHISSLGYLWLCFIGLLTSKSNHSQLPDAGSAGSSWVYRIWALTLEFPWHRPSCNAVFQSFQQWSLHWFLLMRILLHTPFLAPSGCVPARTRAKGRWWRPIYEKKNPDCKRNSAIKKQLLILKVVCKQKDGNLSKGPAVLISLSMHGLVIRIRILNEHLCP